MKLLNQNPKLNIHTASQQTYDSLKTLFQNKLLWTVGISDTTYKDQFLFSNLVLSTELLQGISDPSKAMAAEINFKGDWSFIDDTLKSGRDLKRNILTLEPGLNLVLKNRHTQYSWAEFKLSGSYSHNFNRLYVHEDRDSITVNGTLRIRILNDIWIPLEIKYDPKSGNLFGFLNIRANFTALGSLLKSQKN